MAKSKSRLVRKRFKQAGEPLTEDSSLRDALDDEQAQAMLDMGLAHIKQKAQETADLPEEEASAQLEKLSDRVRRAMRKVNQIATENPEATKGQNWSETLRSLEASLAEDEEAEAPMATRQTEVMSKTSKMQQATEEETPKKQSLFAQLSSSIQSISEAESEHDQPESEPDEQLSTTKKSDSDKDRKYEAL